VRPLPRVHAVTDRAALEDPKFRIRLAAIAAVGPAVAVHARDRTGTDRALTETANRMMAHARPPEASVFVNARPDIAQAIGAHGVQLGAGDLGLRDARRVFVRGWIGASVHSHREGEHAVEEGADFLLVGTIFPSSSHPDRPALGLSAIENMAGLGLPIIAIGGMTPERAHEVRAAGAYGVAAVSALWGVADAGKATLALLQPWMNDDE
jgi:thiamine-phosphate pyrophosphorylase